MIIQVLLILASFLLLFYSLSSRGTHAINAWKKIGVILLTILAIISILFPSLVNSTAQLVGVGRGADLLLYILFALFILYTLTQYVKAQDQRDVVYRLARQVALMDASSRYEDKINK